jgi:hypothetical protein
MTLFHEIDQFVTYRGTIISNVPDRSAILRV